MKRASSLRTFVTVVVAILVVALLPAWALAGPTITKAVLKDANGNGLADGIALTYSTEINHTAQKSGTFPFTVQGYVIKSIGAATNSKKLSIKLVEGSVSDLTVTPFITYTGPASIPVRDLGGVEAQNQDFIKTVAVDPGAAIHVAPTGDDGNPGTAAAPLLTVQAGIDAASLIVPEPDVYVAGGTYEQVGGVSLVSGAHVDGGYMVKNGKWTRSLGAITTIVGAPQAAFAERAVGVSLQLLSLRGLPTGEPGTSAYALRAVDGSTITLWWVTANASDAVAGTDGDAPGGDGTPGADGQPGLGSALGSGGQSDVGANGGNGGAGVSGVAPGVKGQDGSGTGASTGGFAGAAGSCSTTSSSNGGDGGTAVPGMPGAPGTSGAGGTATTAGAAQSWLGQGGGAGGTANPGGGGGGGGSGGGTASGTNFVCTDCSSLVSGGGGGGGAGGKGGGGGSGGYAGGGSFAVYLWDARVTVDGHSVLTSGNGGAGGSGRDGGLSGTGGAGGSGGPGQSRNNMCSSRHAGNGGAGGLGGGGGAGGGGGGAAGGPSIGIFRGNRSSATVATGAVITVGPGGAGGPGGLTPGIGSAPSGATGLAAQIV
jgi:hypothetical protein